MARVAFIEQDSLFDHAPSLPNGDIVYGFRFKNRALEEFEVEKFIGGRILDTLFRYTGQSNRVRADLVAGFEDRLPQEMQRVAPGGSPFYTYDLEDITVGRRTEAEGLIGLVEEASTKTQQAQISRLDTVPTWRQGEIAYTAINGRFLHVADLQRASTQR